MKTAEEKKQAIKELIERGKKKGKLDYKELADALEEMDLATDHIDKLYDTLETLGIEIASVSVTCCTIVSCSCSCASK